MSTTLETYAFLFKYIGSHLTYSVLTKLSYSFDCGILIFLSLTSEAANSLNDS